MNKNLTNFSSFSITHLTLYGLIKNLVLKLMIYWYVRY